MTTAPPNTAPSVNASASAFPSAGELSAALAGLGVTFHRRGEDLALKDPARRLTPDIVEAVRRYKPSLLALADSADERPLSSAAPVLLPPAPQAHADGEEKPARTEARRGGVEAAVLALINEAPPVSHTQLRRTLTERGFADGAVVSAIHELQTRQGLIEHDLKRGYVLTEEERPE